MSKRTKAPKAATPAPVAAPVAAPAPATTKAATPANTQAIVLGKRYNPREGTKHNTVATWAAIVAHLQENGGTASYATLRGIAAANGDAPFMGYALGRKWLKYAEATTAEAPAK